MCGKTRDEIRAAPSQRGKQPQQNPHATILPSRYVRGRMLMVILTGLILLSVK
jgi:hypothetical protein